MTAAAVGRMPRPEPHESVYLRDSNTLSLWGQARPGDWVAVTGEYRVSASWDDLDRGKYGEIELLVPVPYQAPERGSGAHRLGQHVAAAILEPIAAMMQQLAAAAGAGVTAVVADAYRRGGEDAHTAVERDDRAAAAKIIVDAIDDHLHGDSSGSDDAAAAAVAQLTNVGLLSGVRRG